MKVKELLEQIQNLPPETEIQIEDDGGWKHKVIWLMYFKGELTIG